MTRWQLMIIQCQNVCWEDPLSALHNLSLAITLRSGEEMIDLFLISLHLSLYSYRFLVVSIKAKLFNVFLNNKQYLDLSSWNVQIWHICTQTEYFVIVAVLLFSVLCCECYVTLIKSVLFNRPLSNIIIAHIKLWADLLICFKILVLITKSFYLTFYRKILQQ